MIVRVTTLYRLKRFIKIGIWPALLMILYSGTIYYFYEFQGVKQLDISLGISTILGISISLLLGFRTNSAYDRWWEGRKIWGAIINDTRTLVRQLIGYVEGAGQNEVVKEITMKTISWCYALKHSLRNTAMDEDLLRFIDQSHLDDLKLKRNIPNTILKEIEMLVRQLKEGGEVDSYQFVSLDQTLKGLCDHMGKCERIKNTVFPLQYRMFTQAGVVIFCLMLPYGMLLSTGPLVIVVSTVVTLFFMFLEMIAHDLQDPFANKTSDIPMSAICRTIEIDLKQMLDETKVPEVLEPDDEGVLM